MAKIDETKLLEAGAFIHKHSGRLWGTSLELARNVRASYLWELSDRGLAEYRKEPGKTGAWFCLCTLCTSI